MNKLILLSFDGLSTADIEAVKVLMPNISKAIRTHDTCALYEYHPSAPQAIWAEILAGEPWYKNGCPGYAKPTMTLNELSVVSERDLFCPASLVDPTDGGGHSVVINLPLLHPREDRIWLSDGSLPTNKIVWPVSLSKQAPFTRYVARAVSCIGMYDESLAEIVTKILDVELCRLDCALALLSTGDWSKFFYRITAFDLLTHILGLNYLLAEDLACFAQIKAFLRRLDEFVAAADSLPDHHLVIVSGYSHTACRGTANLNEVLQAGGLLQIGSPTSADRVSAGRITAITPKIGTPPARLLTSLDGTLVTAETLAAAPISGCIFINTKDMFDDGIVDSGSYEQVRNEVYACVHNRLVQTFGHSVTVESKPNGSSSSRSAVPDFRVHVEGVEFHNMKSGIHLNPVLPRTTHSPNGFVILPETFQAGPKFRPYELKDVLSNAPGT